MKVSMSHTRSEKYPVILTTDVTDCVGAMLAWWSGTYHFYDGEQLIGVFKNGRITVKSGYACDGYSPSKMLCGLHLRLTPTPKAGLWPAVKHDFMRQFLEVKHCPWTRQDTDVAFYNALVDGGSGAIAGLYHSVVSGAIGTAYIAATRKKNPKLRIIHTL